MLALMNRFLGIECGGTRTVALLGDERGELLQREIAGSANLKLLDDAALLKHFQAIGKTMAQPNALVIGMAGARTESDFARIRRAAEVVWPGVPAHVTNDLETALAAAPEPSEAPDVRVLVLSGTGSCCFGVFKDETAKVGGWGHILGDKGSGYEIGLRGLKAVVYYYDRDGEWPKLGERLLRKLCLNEPNELIEWVQKAGKPDVAALAEEVFAAWHAREKIAIDILDAAASSLAKDAVACAQRLSGRKAPAQFVLAGSVLLKQPRFAEQVSSLIGQQWKKAFVTPLERESAWGAVELARRLEPVPVRISRSKPAFDFPSDLKQLVASPTEQRNPRSLKLDKLPTRAAIRLMLSEDAKIPPAILKQANKLGRVVDWIVQAFKSGGRLFYVGAGTSGRLGVLDASECPPTFRASPEMVQGIIAGGQRALWEAVEGAEDDPAAGARAVEFRGVRKGDVVVGIAASGRTPFVWGALQQAARNGARTVLVCFNPKLALPKWRPGLVIAVDVGPEILTGSTRLKSGTATKLILNTFTTVAMVRIGKVLSNLMIDVKASNTKLRDRAVRILQQLTDCDYATGFDALEKNHWDIKAAASYLKGRRRSGR
jgi:N-acetylmuramic acid 6-phosphate etherase